MEHQRKEVKLKGTKRKMDLEVIPVALDKALDKDVDSKVSSRPTEMRVFCSSEFDESIVVEIEKGKELEWTAGALLTNLTFKIYDEAGLELQKPNLSTSNMKVSWVSLAEMRKVPLNEGKLPNLPTPRTVGQSGYNSVSLFLPPSIQHLTSKGPKANVNVSVDFGFHVKPRPGPVCGLTLTIGGNGTNEVRSNSKMDNDILVKVRDKFQNGVSGITLKSCEELEVFCAVEGFEGNAIDTDCLEKFLGEAEGVIVVRGLKFKKELGSQLGIKTVYISYKLFKEPVVVDLVPDAPEKLRWEFNKEWDNKCLTLCKSSRLEIGIQLHDIFDNKVAYQGAVVRLGTDKNLVLRPEIRKVTTDAKGKANFGVIEISVKDELRPIECPLKTCPSRCFGVLVLRAKASLEGRDIASPMVKFHVICDQSRPAKFQIGCCNEMTPEKQILGDDIIVGKEMPFFKIAMLAEDDTMVPTVYQNELFMEIVKADDPTKKHQDIFATEFENGQFTFEIKEAPELAGIYHLQFHYKADVMFASSVLTLKLKCDEPAKFKPKVNPMTKSYVSNTTNISNRTITSGLRMFLEDKFENFVGLDFDEEQLNSLPMFNGEVVVEIKGCQDQPLEQVPKFSGNKSSLSFPVKKGETFIHSLALDERTCGIDGSEYAIRFTPNLKGLQLEPYEIKFVFVNDAQKQTEMTRLEEERVKEARKMKDIEERLEAIAKEVESFKNRIEMASNSESLCLNKIRKLNGCIEDVIFDRPEDISQRIEVKQLKIKEMEDADNSRSFRECSLAPCPSESGILGKIGHLALLDNPSEAFVLSWHMQADMDVIVTYNSEKAKELNRRYAERQQLIALEGTFRGNLPTNWNGPLPHERVRNSLSLFRVKGNPVYARSLLHFTKDPESCRIIFGSLLGDTLIMDTIEDAIDYRNQLVRNSNCPTILTRNGRRLRNNGKFGGLANKAPDSPSGLRFGCFGLAPNPDIAELFKEIELLKLLFNAFSERINAEDNLRNYEASREKELDQLENDLKDSQELYEKFRKRHAEVSLQHRQQEMRRSQQYPPTNGYSGVKQVTHMARVTPKRSASVFEESDVCAKRKY